ncbi:MAG: hypothetical protein KGN01_07500, partial [Patescibacteria group bacterium]|nr:hypothetical protein [Patescibacteria group bacterium]
MDSQYSRVSYSKARSIQSSRSKRAQEVDARLKASRTFPRDLDDYAVWEANPSHSDIRGIDTPDSYFEIQQDAAFDIFLERFKLVKPTDKDYKNEVREELRVAKEEAERKGIFMDNSHVCGLLYNEDKFKQSSHAEQIGETETLTFSPKERSLLRKVSSPNDIGPSEVAFHDSAYEAKMVYDALHVLDISEPIKVHALGSKEGSQYQGKVMVLEDHKGTKFIIAPRVIDFDVEHKSDQAHLRKVPTLKDVSEGKITKSEQKGTPRDLNDPHTEIGLPPAEIERMQQQNRFVKAYE